MKRYVGLLMLIAFCVVLGCSSNKLKPITLHEKYSKKLEHVNKMIIMSGSTGGKKEITDQEVIDEWLNEVKDNVLYPLEDQEEKDGFLYAISFYENDKARLTFSLNYIDQVYYDTDTEMLKLTTQLFESYEAAT